MISLQNEDNRLHQLMKQEMNNISTRKVYSNVDKYSMNRDHNIRGLCMEINHANHD